MSKEIKILQIVSNIKKNGPAFVALDLAVGLKQNNVDSVVASSGGILIEELNSEGIPHVYIPISRKSDNKITKYFKYVFDFFDSLQILIKSIKKYDINVLHAHQPIPIIFGRILSFVFKIPLVITAHNIFSTDNIINKVYTMGNKIVAVSEEVRQNLIVNFSVRKEKVITIHNGIDIKRVKVIASSKCREEFGIKDDEVLIGIIAGLRKQKALDVFLNALKILTQKVDNLKVLIVGDGELRNELETLCKSLELSEVVSFTGFRNDVLNIMNELDIFCLSSDYEGLPISLLEAMVNNIPVVVTAVGGIPELITSGYNGILVPSQDPISLADELYKVISKVDIRQQLKENAYNTIISEFNNIEMAKKHLRVYKDVLADE
ncbi:glycosyltransferase [Asaccharospora irregularis]|uniref:Glycosyltransferase involved in cell wall bisynthesis n=1 Tax=Asaccharospora irregularis DSM 2635 TaxID=1121321 RepID=A0A1M5PEV9_9FIRM|nr:glycosyltransferase [Asaccharospora irregularis]SHH00285.1 Glycosyltransferase involved in cell wall bisynthesis [Asaccharospora irregularis DSM 2635]